LQHPKKKLNTFLIFFFTLLVSSFGVSQQLGLTPMGSSPIVLIIRFNLKNKYFI